MRNTKNHVSERVSYTLNEIHIVSHCNSKTWGDTVGRGWSSSRNWSRIKSNGIQIDEWNIEFILHPQSAFYRKQQVGINEVCLMYFSNYPGMLHQWSSNQMLHSSNLWFRGRITLHHKPKIVWELKLWEFFRIIYFWKFSTKHII